MILFTSGTTAKKKAVMLSHASVLAATRNINEFMQPDESIREFVSVPLYHSFGLGRVRSVLTTGGTLVLLDGHLNPASTIDAIETFKCNALSAVPAGLALFRGKLETTLRRIGPQIRLIELGSSFLPKERKAALVDIFPHARICMHYGLTEASRSTFLEFRDSSEKLDTVGRPSPNVRIQVRDADSRPCNANVEGEVVISGAHVTSGYFGDEQRTSEAFTPDGWFRTGDYGFLDSDGYLHLLGRKDEIINKGGIKISPLELDAAIKTVFPDLDACVVGVPDPNGLAGEVPVVAYTGPSELNFQDFVAAISSHIERTKLPSALVRVSTIPRTENGKPKRNQLSRELSSSNVGIPVVRPLDAEQLFSKSDK
jgi:long-chain acyl-CoA synthetase